jgi:hypothetical protein
MVGNQNNKFTTSWSPFTEQKFNEQASRGFKFVIIRHLPWFISKSIFELLQSLIQLIRGNYIASITAKL